MVYNTQWLYEYHPNHTFYLPTHDREKMRAQGKRGVDKNSAGAYARKIYNRLLIDLSYNSSRLEGNTYSLLDTERLIFEGASAEGKLDAEKVMILNHKEAIHHLVEAAARIEIDFNEICTLHFLLSDGLVPPQYSGKVRDYGVQLVLQLMYRWKAKMNWNVIFKFFAKRLLKFKILLKPIFFY